MDEEAPLISTNDIIVENGVSNESGGIDPWQLADAILERMDVKDSHTIDEMIHKRAVLSGTIIGGLLLFWWLVFIKFKSTTFNEPELILQLDYEIISAILPLLVFAGSVLNMMSRELGRPGPGTIAGLLQTHKRFGNLPLKKILEPVIKQASSGILVSYDLHHAIGSANQINLDQESQKIYLNNYSHEKLS